MQQDPVNMDLMNIAYALCDGFIYKTAHRKAGLTKDELITYNSALRMLQQMMDAVSDQLYNQKEQNPLDGEQPIGAPA